MIVTAGQHHSFFGAIRYRRPRAAGKKSQYNGGSAKTKQQATTIIQHNKVLDRPRNCLAKITPVRELPVDNNGSHVSCLAAGLPIFRADAHPPGTLARITHAMAHRTSDLWQALPLFTELRDRIADVTLKIVATNRPMLEIVF